jgi:hypothetical protein
MADAVETPVAPVEAEKPTEEAPVVEAPVEEPAAEPAAEPAPEEAPAQNGTDETPAVEEPAAAEPQADPAPEAEPDAVEPPRKRGRPSSGASKRTPKKVKVPQQPTRRSARRSASRSSEASTPTEKKEEPIGMAEKENVDENKEEAAEEKKADAVGPTAPVEAEA